MKVTKKAVDEIVDLNGDLIDLDDVPQNGSNLETAANNTTDYNAKVGHQPFRYDMLGRFGFTLLPFFEGEDKLAKLNQGQAELENDIVDLLNERFTAFLEQYYKNPQSLKTDHRKYVKDKEVDEDAMKETVKWADKVLKIVEEHFGKAFSKLEKIDENSFIEGKILDKKDDKELTGERKKNKDVLDKKAQKIADLINKLDKDEVKKIKNLLETE
jgi:hypothetical protein